MISLVICTYKRAISLKKLLDNINTLFVLPDEILIIDGSPDTDTKAMLDKSNYQLPIKYWLVPLQHRGLTKQRNFGVSKIDKLTDIVCFLDDDITLPANYFTIIAHTFNEHKDCIGLMGVITNETNWVIYNPQIHTGKRWLIYDGFAMKLSERHYLRRLLGLFPDNKPGIIPGFGHGYSALPPSGKTYEVEHIIGCNAYRRWIFDKISHSTYFEGYGLYEDYDFSVRASKYGKLLVNTNLQFEHHHYPASRPNAYLYGKMVTRNGWYVWRLKTQKPLFKERIKWNLISLLLTLILLKSAHKTTSRQEFAGRISGMLSLIFTPPVINY